jgi:hypothetical protein
VNKQQKLLCPLMPEKFLAPLLMKHVLGVALDLRGLGPQFRKRPPLEECVLGTGISVASLCCRPARSSNADSGSAVQREVAVGAGQPDHHARSPTWGLCLCLQPASAKQFQFLAYLKAFT